MTDRERWTVYPLLFLALGVSLKDKLTSTVNTKNLVCNSLQVNDAKTNSRVTIDGNAVFSKNLVCNALQVDDPKTKSRVIVDGHALRGTNIVCRKLVVSDAEGRSVATIASNERGGLIDIVGVQSGVHAALGNFETEKLGPFAGLLFVDAQGVGHPAAVVPAPDLAKKPAADDAKSSEPPIDEQSSADGPPAEAGAAERKQPADKKLETPAESQPESARPESP